MRQDLDGYRCGIIPTDPDLQGPLERILGALDATGFDPFVGRKLYHFAYSAGLTDLHVAVDPYHLIAGTVDAATLRQWYLKLDIARRAAIAAGEESAEVDALRDRFLHYLQRPDTLTHSVVFTITARRKLRRKVEINVQPSPSVPLVLRN